MQDKTGIKEVQSAQLVIFSEKDLLMWHKRLEHPAFKVFESLAPTIYKKCNNINKYNFLLVL